MRCVLWAGTKGLVFRSVGENVVPVFLYFKCPTQSREII
jgi:hypothetical protein